MRTKNKYINNYQRFKKLLHHFNNGIKKKTDKVWLCESIGKIKGVGKQAKAKINELIINTIYDPKLHVNHHGIPNMHIRGFGQIYDITLQALPGKPHPYFKDNNKAKKTYLSRYR